MSNPLNEFLEEYGQPEKTAFDWGRAASGAGTIYVDDIRLIDAKAIAQ